MIYFVLFLVSLTLLAVFWVYGKISEKILNTPPQNSPRDFIANKGATQNKNTIVTIGDSITHGVVSHNYSEMIEAEAAKYGFETVNAGLNADLAYSVVQRIDEIIACQPKVVTILIGTNDVMSTFGNRLKGYWDCKRIPNGQETSLEFYLKNLRTIVKKLKTIPHIKIYIYSLPVLGEDLTSPYNQKIVTYSESIKNLSIEEELNYLPLNESMREYLTEHPSVGSLEFGKEQVASVLAVIRNRYFGQDWNQIARSNNLQLTSETIHLNEKGAQMVADLALEQIIPELQEDARHLV